jgi:DNA modification methylase
LSVSILTGDCRDLLKTLDADSIDSCVTDPPYGLSFMGKAWDYDVPDAETWREVYRVMKPGAHLLAFFGSRTYHRGVVQIEDAGFEIRDQIMWIYGSGFPKSHNLDGDRQGWGTALKPAHEPIVVARKPLAGTVAQNVLRHGTGAINIDASRVSTDDKLGGGNTSATVDRSGKHEGWQRPWMNDAEAAKSAAERSAASVARSESLGRWPANVIHDGSEEVIAGFPDTISGGGPTPGTPRTQVNTYGKPTISEARAYGSNSGSAARFFYCAKASKFDRDEGLTNAEQPIVTFATANGTSGKASSLSEGRATAYKNDHPTVKPTDLMRYLVRLVTPPGGVVLDPFMGSGSTGKAANIEGFSFVGIELDPKWNAVARARIFGATPLFSEETA